MGGEDVQSLASNPHTRELISAQNMEHMNNKDLELPTVTVTHINTRYINSTRGTASVDFA